MKVLVSCEESQEVLREQKKWNQENAYIQNIQ